MVNIVLQGGSGFGSAEKASSSRPRGQAERLQLHYEMVQVPNLFMHRYFGTDFGTVFASGLREWPCCKPYLTILARRVVGLQYS